MKAINIFIFLLLGSFIASCGFHLRGNQDLSADLPEVSVTGINHHSDYGRALIRALTAAKVSVFAESATVLNVNREAFSKRVISLDSAGRANQYELRHDFSFSLAKVIAQTQDKKAKVKQPTLVDIMPAQTISVTKDYLFDPNSVLAGAAEERRLKTDMIEASMLQVIRRLQFSLKAAKKKSLQTESNQSLKKELQK